MDTFYCIVEKVGNPCLVTNGAKFSLSMDYRLNFIQKTQMVHMYINVESRARGLQRLSSLKYYNILKWEK